MRSPRLALAGAAAGALVMGTMFATPAYATDGPGNCASETSGATGYTCPRVGSNLLNLNAGTGLHLGANLNVGGNCNGLLTLLVRARTNEGTERSTLVADENAAATARGNLASAQATQTAAQSADTTEDTTLPDSTAAPDAKDIALANANAALITAQTANTNAATKVRQDKAEENRLLQLVVQLGNDYRNCNTPVPTPTPVPMPCNCTPTPTPTPVPLPGPDTPPVVVPPAVITQPPVVVQSPPVFVQSPQVGTVPSGSVNTGDGSLAE